MTLQNSEPDFDMKVIELRNSLQQAVSSYSPGEVRNIVCELFTGKNYRSLTEKPTRQAISVFSGWILNIAHRSHLKYGQDWKEELLMLVSRKGVSHEEKWLRIWLLGLGLKTAVNLGVRPNDQSAYQQMVNAATNEVVEQLEWEPSKIELSSDELERVSLSPSDSIWLLQIAGAAVLTLRGSKKAAIGKRLEKAIARAALNVVGLKEKDDFNLNIGRDVEVEREIDAEVKTRRGRIRMDIALIGVGNQEVSEDKLARVGKNGIVLVDKLGPKSQVRKNAAAQQVKVIELRDNFALTEVWSHLQPLVPSSISLKKPPANEIRLRKLLNNLPDEVFALPG